MPDQAARRLAPLVLAAACVIISAIGLVQGIVSAPPGGADADLAVQWAARTRRLQAALPEGLTIIGYMDEADIIAGASRTDPGEFALTQYVLAPILLRDTTVPEWIVGNFGNVVTAEEIEPLITQALGPHEASNFGFGLYLIHREAE